MSFKVFHKPWQWNTGNIHPCHWRVGCEVVRGTWLPELQGLWWREFITFPSASSPQGCRDDMLLHAPEQCEKNKWIGTRTERIFIFPTAPPQKCLLLSNFQSNWAARLRWQELKPPALPTPHSPITDITGPVESLFWSLTEYSSVRWKDCLLEDRRYHLPSRCAEGWTCCFHQPWRADTAARDAHGPLLMQWGSQD